MEHSCQKDIKKTILVIVAHPDDEVLGCGASISKWAAEGNEVHILIMAEGETSRDSLRNRSAKSEELFQLNKAAQQAGSLLGASSVSLLNFPDNRMDSLDRLDVIKAIETEITRLDPYMVVTHHCGDLNIDHQIIHESVIVACRPQPGCNVRRLLAFEVGSRTEWQSVAWGKNFIPNWFEDISKHIDIKIEALKIYDSEMRKYPHARSLQNVENLARLRGCSVGFDAAEGFMLLRELA